MGGRVLLRRTARLYPRAEPTDEGRSGAYHRGPVQRGGGKGYRSTRRWTERHHGLCGELHVCTAAQRGARPVRGDCVEFG